MARKKYDTVSRKALFELFDQGKKPSDPEVKALGYKGSTVYKYYSEWSKSGGEREIGKLEATLPKDEKLTGIDEAKIESKAEGEEKGKAVPEVEPEITTSEGKKIPTLPDYIRGSGIPIRVNISVQTLVYYDMAATIANQNGGNLSLGDFIDQCVTDFFEGRGQALGLVKLNKGG